ncbi:hypothetical protein ILUMI_12871 [Ignelater luminosus]|uniref:RING-type E3 ubiquitin transferase n=1 Tax=Ignelater luminosus TaxID=2038154 RepID=A0A8K0CTE0_IGNLU|nr:hypothetical protein ILUMI_12871 [Ignelater luminosus]
MADYFEERGVDANTVEDREIIDANNLMRLLADFNMFDELGLPNQLAPPASQNAIDNLLEEKIKQKGGQCHICLKEYEEAENIKIMPCKHKFHSACIKAWLAKTNSCPLCRYELPTNDEYYEAYRKEKKRAKERASDIENLHNSMFT